MSEETKFEVIIGTQLEPGESEQIALSALKILVNRALKHTPYDLNLIAIIRKGGENDE